MKLFAWTSEAFKEWGSGQILVMAESVEEARKKSRALYEQSVMRPYAGTEHAHIRALVDEQGNFIDDDAKLEYTEKMAVFDADIREEPDIIESGVAFIHGSE